MLSTIANGLLAALAYGVIGTVLLGLGYVLVDLVTPGPLHRQIWHDNNRNASIVLVSGLIGVAIIVTTAIATSSDNLAQGLIATVLYGILGLIFMGIAFMLLDLATPGKLGALLVEQRHHPAVWITGTINVSLGAIIAAAIS